MGLSKIELQNEIYKKLRNGVAKADFFRICYINTYGGYWFDIDLEPINITNLHEKVKDFVLLHSYIITPKGAQKILEQLPINMPVDSWLSSISDKINIYRHNYGFTGKNSRFNGTLITQVRNEKQIVNTNII